MQKVVKVFYKAKGDTKVTYALQTRRGLIPIHIEELMYLENEIVKIEETEFE